MKSSISSIFAFGSILLFTIGSITGEENGIENGSGSGMSWEQTTLTATVENVMPDSGMVTLRGDDGQLWTLSVGQDVKLENLKQGDKVQVTLFQGQALEVRKPTDMDRQQPLVVVNEVQPPKGVNPTVGMLRQLRALVTVTNIDRTNNRVTIEGPKGNSYVLQVKDSSLLDKIEKGKQFVVIFTEGIVAKIQKM
jgi:general stress protein 26